MFDAEILHLARSGKISEPIHLIEVAALRIQPEYLLITFPDRLLLNTIRPAQLERENERPGCHRSGSCLRGAGEAMKST